MSNRKRLERLEKLAKSLFNQSIVKLVFKKEDIIETDENIIYVLMEI